MAVDFQFTEWMDSYRAAQKDANLRGDAKYLVGNHLIQGSSTLSDDESIVFAFGSFIGLFNLFDNLISQTFDIQFYLIEKGTFYKVKEYKGQREYVALSISALELKSAIGGEFADAFLCAFANHDIDFRSAVSNKPAVSGNEMTLAQREENAERGIDEVFNSNTIGKAKTGAESILTVAKEKGQEALTYFDGLQSSTKFVAVAIVAIAAVYLVSTAKKII